MWAFLQEMTKVQPSAWVSIYNLPSFSGDERWGTTFHFLNQRPCSYAAFLLLFSNVKPLTSGGKCKRLTTTVEATEIVKYEATKHALRSSNMAGKPDETSIHGHLPSGYDIHSLPWKDPPCY